MEADSLANRMTAWARSLASEPDPAALLAHVAAMTLAEVPGAHDVGVAVFDSSGLSTKASVGVLALRMDTAQRAVHEGPCLDAATRKSVRSGDLTFDPRWPRLAPHAAEVGVRSALALSLFVTSRPLGVLSIYATTAGAFGQIAEAIGSVLAAHAAVAIAAMTIQVELRTALESRDLIGQAKGVLMERCGVSAEEAFHWLTVTSQRSNIKLRDVARELMSSRDSVLWTAAAPVEPPQ
ncbi:GAF and ANTAR domain-containing protein [Micromonospora sp. NPDC050417]|uniref:GAF and ANTAR domain-containing protein n=1 Tax=Micromonospora sp. NPDC050417 TaxID=3364280 RepID=UPI00378836E4